MNSFALSVLAVLLSWNYLAEDCDRRPEAPPPAAPAEERQEELESEFARSMSGAELVGYFTVDGEEEQKGLKEETYRLRTVKKLPRGDYWLFEYRYGDDQTTIPVTLQVKWAGDTPVITLTDAGIPGLGTFSARVVFYRGHYAGTWSASDHGGKLFGKVVEAQPDDSPEEEPEPDETLDEAQENEAQPLEDPESESERS